MQLNGKVSDFQSEDGAQHPHFAHNQDFSSVGRAQLLQS